MFGPVSLAAMKLTESQGEKPDDNDGCLCPASRGLELEREADGVPAVHGDEGEGKHGHSHGHRLQNRQQQYFRFSVNKYPVQCHQKPVRYRNYEW